MYRSVLILPLICGLCLAAEIKSVEPPKPKTSDDAPADTSKLKFPSPIDTFPRDKRFRMYDGNQDSVTFFGAWRKCLERGQELASVESNRDNRKITRVLEGITDPVWLAGTDYGDSDAYNFVWVTNQRPIGYWNDYTNWNSGEPGNSGASCIGTKLVDGEAKWFDYDCDSTRYYICQYYENEDSREHHDH